MVVLRMRAFTLRIALVELLVVIAIIGILIALLLATVQAAPKARWASHGTNKIEELNGAVALGCTSAPSAFLPLLSGAKGLAKRLFWPTPWALLAPDLPELRRHPSGLHLPLNSVSIFRPTYRVLSASMSNAACGHIALGQREVGNLLCAALAFAAVVALLWLWALSHRRQHRIDRGRRAALVAVATLPILGTAIMEIIHGRRERDPALPEVIRGLDRVSRWAKGRRLASPQLAPHYDAIARSAGILAASITDGRTSDSADRTAAARAELLGLLYHVFCVADDLEEPIRHQLERNAAAFEEYHEHREV